MKKSTLGVIIAFIAVMAIAGIVMANRPNKTSTLPGTTTSSDNMDNMPSNTQSTESSGGVEDLTNKSEVTIDIKDFAFSSPNIKIKKGTKVIWTNQDTVKHNAFSDDANGPKGELLGKGESYSFVFDTVGTNNYYCTPHPYMKGVVNVIE